MRAPRELEVQAEPSPPVSGVPHTPMMRQYLDTKAQHPEAILFFRLGDFYEMFLEDAVKAAEILQITLTSRAKGPKESAERVPMCGVPYHSARRYIARLIEAGLSVAICEQTAPADGQGTAESGKALFKREVIRVITPGMVLDDEVLESRENNFLAALQLGEASDSGGPCAAALLDASTGEFFCVLAAGVDELSEQLARSAPRELIVSEAIPPEQIERIASRLARRPAITGLPAACFELVRASAFLRAHFQVTSLDGFGLAQCPAATSAAGAALRYLKDTQRTAAPHVDRLQVAPRGGYLELDETSRANLEILRTLKDGSRKGALLGVLDRTATPMGARKLARWLSAPLTSLPAIEARLEAVDELSRHALWREALTGSLKEVADLERLCGRLTLAVGNARDLKALGRSLLALPSLVEALERCASPLLRGLRGPLGEDPELAALAGLIDRAILDEPQVSLSEGGLVKPGYHPELDEWAALSSSGKEFLLQIEARERERTGIASLKVRYNKVFGYYLEVTRSNLSLVPKDYVRKQTTVGAERYVTPELKEYEEKVLTAEERRCALEQQIFEELRAQVIAAAPRLRSAAEAVASCDVLISFARCAAEYGYTRPVVDDSEVIEISAGRHPVIERMLLSDPFVPNDVRLDRKASQVLVITGPNMAGKSTVMRQVALTALMAQAGSFVPARAARIGVCDRVFTRVGAADNLARGQSTFMVEMTETANILHHATRRSLVILDEIGRGTSTFDGLSIAWAVAEHLHDRVGARTMFATHYHELTELAREKGRVVNCSIAVRTEPSGKIVFLRKLVPGGASRSYGIEVARLAGLPLEVVARAREILANLESGELDDAGHPRLIAKPATAGEGETEPSKGFDQLGLFGPTASEPPLVLAPDQQQVLEELRGIAVEATTPIEALNTIARWQRALG